MQSRHFCPQQIACNEKESIYGRSTNKCKQPLCKFYILIFSICKVFYWKAFCLSETRPGVNAGGEPVNEGGLGNGKYVERE